MQHISRDDIEAYDKRYRTQFINSLTGFKSVALIGTQDQNNKTNLAIFSQIIHVGANPPLIGVLFRPHTVSRHTLENILELKDFTINHIPACHVQSAHHTSARWEQSEFESCGFTPDYSPIIKAPYVKESNVQIGCSYVERQNIQANDTVLVIAEIKEVRLIDSVVSEDGFIDLETAGSITCSGLDSYHTTNSIGRYSYAKPNEKPQEL